MIHRNINILRVKGRLVNIEHIDIGLSLCNSKLSYAMQINEEEIVDDSLYTEHRHLAGDFKFDDILKMLSCKVAINTNKHFSTFLIEHTIFIVHYAFDNPSSIQEIIIES